MEWTKRFCYKVSPIRTLKKTVKNKKNIFLNKCDYGKPARNRNLAAGGNKRKAEGKFVSELNKGNTFSKISDYQSNYRTLRQFYKAATINAKHSRNPPNHKAAAAAPLAMADDDDKYSTITGWLVGWLTVGFGDFQSFFHCFVGFCNSTTIFSDSAMAFCIAKIF